MRHCEDCGFLEVSGYEYPESYCSVGVSEDDAKFDEDSLREKVARLADIMRQGHDGSEYRMLPSESQARADRLESEAISLVEEITGEDWEFAYMYFG